MKVLNYQNQEYIKEYKDGSRWIIEDKCYTANLANKTCQT
jgi:hypothetical protein